MDLFPMHSWHPMVVHFPIVAFLVAVALDLVRGRRMGSRWWHAGTVLWLIALGGAAVAITTGFLAYNRVEHSDVGHGVMTLHRNLALVAAGLLAVTGLLRWRRPTSWLPQLLGVLGVLALLGVGFYGGELVFRHAIGIPTSVLMRVMDERGAHDHDMPMSAPADSGMAPEDTAATRRRHDSIPHSH